MHIHVAACVVYRLRIACGFLLAVFFLLFTTNHISNQICQICQVTVFL